MKIPLLLLAALLALQDGEADRPRKGPLPDRGQGLGDEEHRGSQWLATRILDGATGRPIPGARLLRTPEWIDESRLRHDMVMSEGVADADGVAYVPADGHLFRKAAHWLALAPGYAPGEEYGPVPPAEMRLVRGRPMSFRVLDPLGRPVAGAVLEFLDGCSHGTAGAAATAGADGVAAFPNLDPGHGQLWVRGPGIESALRPLPDDDSLGTRPDELVMEFGRRYEGRVVDLLGAPVPGCVVRVHNEQRGPTAMTGPDGRFVLEGAAESSLYVFPAVDLALDGSERRIDDAHPGIPCAVVSTSVGVVRPEGTAAVVVGARDPEGNPVGGIGFRLVHADSGRGPSGSTGESGCSTFPGTFRILPSSPFDPFTFDPAEVRAEAGKAAAVVLPLRPRPHLRIRGEIPGGAHLVLAVEGDTLDEEDEGAAWSPPLPATEAAVLRVQVKGRPTFFIPVGPEKEGFREAAVALPDPRRIPLPPGAKEALLLQGTRGVLSFEGEGALLTDATGPLRIRWRDAAGATREVDAATPAAAPRTVVRQVRVRALGSGKDGMEATFHDSEEEPGEMVVVEREGWRTLRAVAPETGLDLRWGTAAIRLTLNTADGKPADALVLVDGEVYAAKEGLLQLRGLDPGPHRVVAALRDEVVGGREFEVVLKDGEERERTVSLGEE